MWREALIVDTKQKEIKVRYRGIAATFDEWIHTEKEEHRIKEVGALSNAHGWAK